jgi:hypothetical protein
MKATELSEILPTPLQVEDESFWQQHCEAHQAIHKPHSCANQAALSSCNLIFQGKRFS